MFSELKKFSWPTIGLICIFGVVLVGWILPPILWPGGIGIGKDDSVTTTTVETIEKDKQGKTVKKVTTTAHNDGKTLWDWGSLLLVPSSLLLFGYILQLQQQKRAEKLSTDQQKRAEAFSEKQEELAKKFAEEQRDIADDETKEEVLQTYFDRLSVLLIDRNLIALSNKSNSSTITPEEQELLDSALDVIRARTLSILRRFEKDAERKTSVIDFLIETEIIGKSKLNLSGAELVNAELGNAELGNAKLRNANLIGANLFWSKLKGADLGNANLFLAKLEGAELQNANLFLAKLKGANLTGANLTGADLSWADLQGANLQRANLKDIKWDSKTKWPDKIAFIDAKNIPEELKKELGITP